MKKFKTILLTFSFTVLLTGCGPVDSIIKSQMIKQSEVSSDENYVLYEENKSNGTIDDEGYYYADDSVETAGSIHVTFATNNNLDVKYYYDADMKNEIDTTACYINPGDSIYATADINNSVNSTMYEFSGFEVFEYDAEENQSESSLAFSEKDSKYELTIPTDFDVTELSIAAYGKYVSREISLKDYYVDNDGKKHDLDGTWEINDKICTEDTAKIDPVSAYIISYKYDAEKYFYVDSEPENYYQDNTSGEIIFKQRESTDETVAYEVQLQEYLQISINNDAEERKVIINSDSENEKSLKNGEELDLSEYKLKYGEEIVIETDEEWPALETEEKLNYEDEEKGENLEYKYKLRVPEKDGNITFNPDEYSYEHGSVTFIYKGKEVTDTIFVSKGTKIQYEQKSAESGWYLVEGEVEVADEEKTKEKLNAIHFVKKVPVEVTLSQPEEGGSITYYVDGKKVTEGKYSGYSGDKITAKFHKWEGWFLTDNITDTYECTVKKSGEITDESGNALKNHFEEDKNHKPELNITLKKGVAGIHFSFSQGEETIKKGQYEKTNKISSDCLFVENKKIGTAKAIKVSMSDKSIQSGKAVKILIEKKAKDKKSLNSTEIKYIDSVSVGEIPIEIYGEDIATNTTWYKSIDITIDLVDVKAFREFTAENLEINVKRKSDQQQLSRGDLIGENDEVIVTLTPNDGYAIEGGNIEQKSAYQATMTYKKYLSKIETMIKKHPAREAVSLKLDTSDKYAEYTYEIDGEQCSGTVAVVEDTEITLTYKIIESGYSLAEKSGGVFGVGSSDKKVKKSIKVTSDMDGKTLTKEDFGVSVKASE